MNLITGNKFKNLCNFFFDGEKLNPLNEIQNNDDAKFFLCAEHVPMFFDKFRPHNKFILVTHNGDNHINDRYSQYLSDPLLVKWYAQNVDIIHPKLKSIPIGIANEIWPHGNEEVLKKIINENNVKNNLVYSNFSINTNFETRIHCQREISKKGIQMSEIKNFESYLRELSKSFFNISPNGNGVDCHKTWESLYLRTIPIVTKSINIDFYKNLPILIIDDWSELDTNILTEENYNKIWSEFNPEFLNVNYFIDL